MQNLNEGQPIEVPRILQLLHEKTRGAKTSADCASQVPYLFSYEPPLANYWMAIDNCRHAISVIENKSNTEGASDRNLLELNGQLNVETSLLALEMLDVVFRDHQICPKIALLSALVFVANREKLPGVLQRMQIVGPEYHAEPVRFAPHA